MAAGYFRYPTIAGSNVVFVSEDDLWTVPVEGGMARRLTSGLGKANSPALSKDGQWLAFTSTEEGHAEVFLMPAEGGEPVRMTHLGCETRVIGWTKAGEILFASNHQHAFARLTDAYALDPKTQAMRKIDCGPAKHVDFDAEGRAVISRLGGTDLAYWKRYRGGLAGELWVDRSGKGEFQKLLQRDANCARPFWMNDRIVFIADHEGMGNVYSARVDGTDLVRHTEGRDYYARGLSVDGTRLVWFAGGDLYFMDAGGSKAKPRKIEVDFRSPRTQTNRRFVSAPQYLEDFDLDPKGDKAVISARGKTFSFELWQGPVQMHGSETSTRYRLGRFMRDGHRVAMVCDAGGEERIEIHDVRDRTSPERLERLSDGLTLGRVLEMKISPARNEAVISNHRNELIWVKLSGESQSSGAGATASVSSGAGVNAFVAEAKVLDRSQFSRIRGFNWSPDGKWIAYGASISERATAIKIVEVATGQSRVVTKPLLADDRPFFDPSGEYLYFISRREFDPVYDSLHFDLGFPRGSKPYLLTLRKDVLSPFSSDHPGRTSEKDKAKDEGKASEAKNNETGADPKAVMIDFDGIEDRIVPLPVSDGRYGQVAAIREKVFFTRLPIKGSLRSDLFSSEVPSDAQLEMLDLETERVETINSNITSFKISGDGKQLIYRAGDSLRVFKAGDKTPRDDDHRRGGWLDLKRVQIPVVPREEWRQMYREAWRLQRDHFWTESMSRVDWLKVYGRYLPLLERVGARSEVSDVIWEMQGELGTSHAYEIGGDYRTDPHFGIGFLGIEGSFDEKENGFRLEKVMKGDLWDETCSSPLARAGVGLEPGDFLLAIDGQPLGRETNPHQALLHRAGKEVAVTFRRKGSKTPETRSIRALRSEQKLRYREWVEANRARVHRESKGRVGYLHVPNMGPFGYAEFHRAFLTEIEKDGLIVDVRYNGGGHVSQLLLEKLARRRIGYQKSRWFGVNPYPYDASTGALVALTNEYAGSDGDIFSHAFKLMKLGPLIGKRTWGGVIGISPSHGLIDGGMTTQPEYAFWFEDVGWRVENYGTVPDIEVEFTPADYVQGRDPQLAVALEVCLKRIQDLRPVTPTLEDGPDLSLPGDLGGFA